MSIWLIAYTIYVVFGIILIILSLTKIKKEFTVYDAFASLLVGFTIWPIVLSQWFGDYVIWSKK